MYVVDVVVTVQSLNVFVILKRAEREQIPGHISLCLSYLFRSWPPAAVLIGKIQMSDANSFQALSLEHCHCFDRHVILHQDHLCMFAIPIALVILYNTNCFDRQVILHQDHLYVCNICLLWCVETKDCDLWPSNNKCILGTNRHQILVSSTMLCTALTLTEVQIIVRKYLATHILYCSIHLILSGVNSTTPILPLPTLAHWVSISESEQASRMAFLPGLKKQINKVRSGSNWKFDFLKFFSRQISLWARESAGWKEQNLTMISTGDEDKKIHKRIANIVQ